MINLFTNLPRDKRYIIDFIKNSQNLIFKTCDENKLDNYKNTNNLFLIAPQTKKNDLDKILFLNSQKEIKNIFYLLPVNFKETFDNKIENKAFYPIDFIFFEERINNFFSQKIFLNDILFLSNDNLLTNINTKNKIYLTEIESKIIKLLKNKDSVRKEEINEIVLGHKTIIESKSLDTHLYRLRNKLNKVTNQIKITHDSKKNIIMTIN